MTWDDFLDALTWTWALVIGFGIGATLALQFGGWMQQHTEWFIR